MCAAFEMLSRRGCKAKSLRPQTTKLDDNVCDLSLGVLPLLAIRHFEPANCLEVAEPPAKHPEL